eukprot:TRINITY_DN14011_c0_g2_i1.p1 TRINITY_DN14011_c0_g2~~TRINITY_DN14011_c0_g2_i1.p1  ORF type:complete len:689 (+),score=172.82 TRINITY_DN14011_c0_g2_i1:43-2109(+)
MDLCSLSHCSGGCAGMGFFDRRLRNKGVADDEHLELKKAYVRLLLGCALAIILVIPNSLGLTSSSPSMSAFVVLMWGLFLIFAAMGRLCITRHFNDSFDGVIFIGFAFMIVGLDYTSLGVLDFWVLQVLCMDAVLVFGAANWCSPIILCLTVLYLLARGVQNTYQVGFWGFLPGSAKYEPYQAPAKDFTLQMGTLIATCTAFIGDFFVTRSFAFALRSRQKAMKVSQVVTEDLTALLSAYEVEAAQELLQGEGSAALPPKLKESFITLVGNLQTYKPYLPQSCFPVREEEEDEVSYDQVPSDDSHPSPPMGRGSPPMGRGSPPMRRSSPRTHTSIARSGTRPSSASTAQSDASGGEVLPSRRPSRRARGSAGSDTQASSHGEAPGELAARRRSHSVQGAVQAAPRTLSATLICVNRCGFLQWILSQGVEAAQGLLQTELDCFAKLAVQHRGIVDTLCGDHYRASFNAARPCATRCPSAARCAAAFSRRQDNEEPGEALTSAVCSGQFVCGDFGSTAIVRFMLIGRQHNFLTVLERVAADWRVGVLVDAQTHADLAQTWRSRLICTAVFHKQNTEKLSMLYEVIQELYSGSTDNNEWMYELESMDKDPWACYNAAMRLWLSGRSACARSQAVVKCDDPSVAAALQKIAEGIDAGRPAPLYTLAEAGAALLPPEATGAGASDELNTLREQ